MSKSDRRLDDSGTVEVTDAVEQSPLPGALDDDGDRDSNGDHDGYEAAATADDQGTSATAEKVAGATPDRGPHDLLRPADDDASKPVEVTEPRPPPVEPKQTQVVSGDPLLRAPAPTPEKHSDADAVPSGGERRTEPDRHDPPATRATIEPPGLGPQPDPSRSRLAPSIPPPPGAPTAARPPATNPAPSAEALLGVTASAAPSTRRASRGAQVAPPPTAAPAPRQQVQAASHAQPVATLRPTTVAPVPRLAGRRPRVRRVTRVVRHLDPWSVFKVAAVFSFVTYGVALVAGVLLWNVAYATGTIDNIERGLESTGWSTFELNGGEIFHNAWIGGLFVAVGLTGLAVLAATLFNLITDLVGGVRVTVLEEEVIEKTAAPMRRFATRRQQGAERPTGPPSGQSPLPQTTGRGGRGRR